MTVEAGSELTVDFSVLPAGVGIFSQTLEVYLSNGRETFIETLLIRGECISVKR